MHAAMPTTKMDMGRVARIGVGDGGHDGLRPAHALQPGGGIFLLAVDVDVRTQRQRVVGDVAAAPIGPFDVGGIGAADAAGLDLDQHLPGARRGRLALHQLEGAGLGDLHGAVSGLHGQFLAGR
jgi:hypothetical protein